MGWIAGRTDEALELLGCARAAHDALHDEAATALVDSRLAEIDFNEGRLREAVERMTPALEAIDRVGTPAEVAATAAQLGRFLVFAREYEQGAALLERALGLAEELRLPETLAHALNSKAVMMLYRNRRLESRLLVRGALAVALEHDLHDAALRAYNNVIAGCWYETRFREAVTLVDDALEYARRTGERGWEVVFLIGKIGQLTFLGRWDEALESAAAAELYATTEFHHGLLLAADGVHVRRGDVVLARELIDRHDTRLSENLEFAAGAYAADAQVLMAEGRHDDAYAAALRAMPDVAEAAWWVYFEVAEVAFELPDESVSRDLLARVAAESGGKRWPAVEALLGRLRARFPEFDAISELETAEQMFRELEMPYYVAAAQAERSHHLFAAGRADEAQRLEAEAREVFERLGAKPALAALGRERAVA
jgi:tetratricopeptide (TPR) repeat protein